MKTEEYPAMIYKSNRNRVYLANCIVKNVVGFGKTEKDAIDNLKESLQRTNEKCKILIKPVYGFLMAQ